jgi:hypothetical protein
VDHTRTHVFFENSALPDSFKKFEKVIGRLRDTEIRPTSVMKMEDNPRFLFGLK